MECQEPQPSTCIFYCLSAYRVERTEGESFHPLYKWPGQSQDLRTSVPVCHSLLLSQVAVAGSWMRNGAAKIPSQHPCGVLVLTGRGLPALAQLVPLSVFSSWLYHSIVVSPWTSNVCKQSCVEYFIRGVVRSKGWHTPGSNIGFVTEQVFSKWWLISSVRFQCL